MNKEEYELIYADALTGVYVLMHPKQKKAEQKHNLANKSKDALSKQGYF